MSINNIAPKFSVNIPLIGEEYANHKVEKGRYKKLTLNGDEVIVQKTRFFAA